jgi:hypothetical protein
MKLLYDDEKNKILKNQFLELFQSKIYSTFHYKEGLLFDQIILSNHFFEPNFEFILSKQKSLIRRK